MSLLTVLYNIILSPITQIIEISYKLFFQLFKNTGISLIGVSFTVTLLCLPLYIVAENWQETERDTQNRMKKGIERIKKAFKGDEQYMILSTFYKQNHYHPLMALRSSFGILIQIPFFLAAYHTLSSLPDLQGKTFLFIRDMGMPDAVFKISSFNINILPIAMTLINCISGAVYSKGHGLREKVQIYGMALIFLVVLYNSPAGLVVYWTMNNILSLVKNVFYKLKNPLKVLYMLFCVAVVAIILYIWFVYSKGAGVPKKLAATIALLLALPLPVYVYFVNYLLGTIFRPLTESSKARLLLFLFSAIALVILTGLVLPTALISSSTQEFSDIENYRSPLAFLHSSFWISFGLILFWPTCIYFLFKEKIQTLLSVSFVFLLFSGTINAFVFSRDLGSMDATLKFIDGLSSVSSITILANILVTLLIIGLICCIIKSGRIKILESTSLIASLAFIALSCINGHAIQHDYAEYKKIAAKNAENRDDFAIKYHLSKTEKNVVVFMFDRFENSYIPYILNDCSGLAEQLDGFVYYPNTISFNGHTLMGSPGVYGGYDYTPYEMNKRDSVTLKEKHNEALSLLPVILGKEAGFESTLSDLSWANYSWIADMSFADDIPNTTGISLLGKYASDFKKEFLKDSQSLASLGHILNRNLFWVSIFRESFIPLRPIVYYKGTWWENGIKETSASFVEWYSALHYLPNITAVDSEKPTLNVITNEATHSSENISMYNLELGETNSLPKESSYPANIAVMQALTRFISYLKEHDIYDNTRIIVTSDHGIGIRRIAEQDYTTPDIDGYSKDHFHCVLLVKDFNSRLPFTTDESFMTNADVPSLALEGIIEHPTNPFTGNPITQRCKKDGVWITKENLFQPGHSNSKYTFTVPEDSWYLVKDNIFIDTNWQKVSK